MRIGFRFWHLVDSAMDEHMVAPLSKEWIGNFSDLVPSQLLGLQSARRDFLKVLLGVIDCNVHVLALAD